MNLQCYELLLDEKCTTIYPHKTHAFLAIGARIISTEVTIPLCSRDKDNLYWVCHKYVTVYLVFKDNNKKELSDTHITITFATSDE